MMRLLCQNHFSEICNQSANISTFKIKNMHVDLIACHPRFVYLYSVLILKDRFLAGEPIIANDINFAMIYARDVIHGRFLLAEPIIAKNKFTAKEYTLLIKEDFILDGKLICSIEDAKANRYASKTITSLNRIPT